MKHTDPQCNMDIAIDPDIPDETAVANLHRRILALDERVRRLASCNYDRMLEIDDLRQELKRIGV